MSRILRRFELLLPLRFNDGQAVPDDLLADTLLELESRFGAVSCEFKERLKVRFQQLDIWLTTYPVEAI